MLRNLASSLFLTERDAEFDENAPKVSGRVVTTLHKAKEVRPLVEKCITIARRTLHMSQTAEQFATQAERGSEGWKSWRQSEEWQKWCAAQAPVVAARRRTLQLLGDKEAVAILFDNIAPRFADRPGGYTRVMRLANHRIGDAGTQAILELVGKNDRKQIKSARPKFDSEPAGDDPVEEETASNPEDSPKGKVDNAWDESDE